MGISQYLILKASLTKRKSMCIKHSAFLSCHFIYIC